MFRAIIIKILSFRLRLVWSFMIDSSKCVPSYQENRFIVVPLFQPHKLLGLCLWTWETEKILGTVKAMNGSLVVVYWCRRTVLSNYTTSLTIYVWVPKFNVKHWRSLKFTYFPFGYMERTEEENFISSLTSRSAFCSCLLSMDPIQRIICQRNAHYYVPQKIWTHATLV